MPSVLYSEAQPTRVEVDGLRGLTVLEFGADWCSICQFAQHAIDDAIAIHQARSPVRHLKVRDSNGQPLGRSFGISLWPTLVLLRDGHEVGRLVRPSDRLKIVSFLQEAGQVTTSRDVR